MEQGFLEAMKGVSGVFAQSGSILVGLGLTAIGCVLLYHAMKRRRNGIEVDGTIVGLRRHGKFFYPVYRYSFPEGDAHEAMSDTGTANAQSAETGKIERIMVSRENPQAAHVAAHSRWIQLGALALLIPGIALLFHAYTSYEVTGVTVAITVAALMYGFNKYRRLYGTMRERKMVKDLRSDMWGDLAHQPVETMEDLRADPCENTRMARTQQLNGMIGALFALLGALGLAGGIYLGAEQALLRGAGLTAPGKVIELAGGQTGGKNSKFVYRPVIDFRDKDGNDHRFQDRHGRNPPAFEEGEEVTVMYFKDDPAASATLDHGWEDWAPAGLLTVCSLLFLLGGLSRMPRQRDEVR